MSCSTHLIECLINKGFSPKAYASSSSDNAQQGITYNTDDYYHTNRENKAQWWYVDFIEPIAINSYQIATRESGCSRITKWTASVSIDFNDWIPVDQKDESSPPNGRTYLLNQTSNARYFKIDGGTRGCRDDTAFCFYYIKFFCSFDFVKTQRTKNICVTQYRRCSYINKNILFSIFMIC